MLLTHTRTAKGHNLTPQCTSWLDKGSKHCSPWHHSTAQPHLYLQLRVVSLRCYFSNWKIEAGFVLVTINRWPAMFIFPYLADARSPVGEVFISTTLKCIISPKNIKNTYLILANGCVRWKLLPMRWSEITALTGSLRCIPPLPPPLPQHPHKGLSSSWGWRQCNSTMCSYVCLAPAAVHQWETSSVLLRENTAERQQIEAAATIKLSLADIINFILFFFSRKLTR